MRGHVLLLLLVLLLQRCVVCCSSILRSRQNCCFRYTPRHLHPTLPRARAQTHVLRRLTQLRYINAVYFGFEALVINEFRDLRLDCSAGIGADATGFILTAFPNMSAAHKGIVAQMTKPQQGCVCCAVCVLVVSACACWHTLGRGECLLPRLSCLACRGV